MKNQEIVIQETETIFYYFFLVERKYLDFQFGYRLG